ncbi:MAG TPA: RNB domain-containing ribonuclease [Burkholderiales bacterium]|nr:RNB domain-containing ribonuclease [Burkholderiales bacterium]
MNVFYEEDGQFRVGAVLADNNASLQVEAPHGRRSKVKSSAVLFRFEQLPLSSFMDQAQKLADGIDVDFLWQCCSDTEFSYESLAREYFGHAPGPLEFAGILLRLHGAPMYFYKKGRGRYKAAPEDALKAALAGMEKKRQQALKKEEYIAQLTASRLPPEFRPLLNPLLYKPDRNSIEWKALDEASAALRLSPVRLIERCGALPSSHDYHFNRFLFEHFPRGTGFGAIESPPLPAGLPLAAVRAFSIDDVTTTEIDDALSVTPLPGGNWQVGIHISAPALGVAPGSAADQVARERLSTVYFPGAKITMLPQEVIGPYSLDAGGERPALSCYVELTPVLEVVAVRSAVEKVPVAANLRLDALDPVFNAEGVAQGAIQHPFGPELMLLWRFVNVLEAGRGKAEAAPGERLDYSFYVENDRVRIVPRRRGTPLDKVVSELMIFVNRHWGEMLDGAGVAAIYRNQGNGLVRMSTAPSGHAGLGVEHYIWASSPLRRYIDLLNQRQIIALVRGETPVYQASSEALLSALRDFEVAYEAYAEFQRAMERYWCLRWMLQEGVAVMPASVLRENLVRFDRLPLVVRVPSLPVLEGGARVELAVSNIDLLGLTFHCEFQKRLETLPDASNPGVPAV